MIAVGTPQRVVMKGRHGRKIPRGDRRFARSKRKIPRQLRPEGRLEREILTGDEHPRIGEDASCLSDLVVEPIESPEGAARLARLELRQIDHQLEGKMMIA